jgi:uncharacterized protein YcbX
VARVSLLSIAPVKGLGLVHPGEVLLERTGVRENRRFHVVDADGRRFNQIREGRLVRVRPEYDAERERLTLRFPDRTRTEGTVEPGEEIVTDFYGRAVRGRVVEGPWSEALSRQFGRALRLVQSAPGEAIDRPDGHFSLVSEASLDELARRTEEERVDGRRFRMLVQVAGARPHEEDEWIGGHVRVGDAVVRILGVVARCAITTQNPETGIPDLDTLRAIRGYRRRDDEREIPFGVYGEVTEPGRVRLGDEAAPVALSLRGAAVEESRA